VCQPIAICGSFWAIARGMSLAPSRGMRTFVVVAVFMLSTACGGQTDGNSAGGQGGTHATGGSGGLGGSGGATGGSGGFVPSGGSGGGPNGCSVLTSILGPYPVTFRFTNPITEPLYIRQDCMITWSLYGCTDDFKTELAHRADCMSDCSEDYPGGGCVACGACMMQGLEVTNVAPVTDDWNGMTYTFGKTASGCSCYNPAMATAGKYLVRVPVYKTKEDAEFGNVAYQSEVYFDLPAPNGVVEVPVVLLD
jgi:hypothetical protein